MVFYYVPGGATLNRGLVGYWRLDDKKISTSTAINRSNFNDGTISGDVTGDTDINGVTNNALAFAGNNDFVSIPNVSPINFIGNFTISFWLKPDNANMASEVILGRGITGLAASSDIFFKFEISGGSPKNRLFVVDSLGASTIIITTTNYTAGEWVHIVGRYDGAKIALFEDGQLIVDDTMTGAVQNDGSAWRLGGGNESAGWLDGSLYKVRVYNRALTNGEINKLFRLRL